MSTLLYGVRTHIKCIVFSNVLSNIGSTVDRNMPRIHRGPLDGVGEKGTAQRERSGPEAERRGISYNLDDFYG